jgi:hypothetical protein
MATNPPITIGIFTNVPAPGSGVKSAFHQQMATFVSPTPWTAPTLVGGWVASVATRYRKEGDRVWLRGNIASGTMGAVAFTLPVGFRPTTPHQFAAVGGGGNHGYVQVNTNGDVIPAIGTNTSYSLDGVSFSTVA